MSTFDSPSLNLSAFPADFYQHLADSNPSLGVLNGSQYLNRLPIYLSDSSAMRAANLRLAKQVQRISPWHRFMASGLSGHVLTQIQEEWQKQQMARVVETYEDYKLLVHEYNGNALLPRPVLGLSQLAEDRLTQHHRATAQKWLGRIRNYIELLIDLLNREVTESGYRWSLRPLIAFPNRYAEDLLKSSFTSSIPYPAVYYTKAQAAVAEALADLNLNFGITDSENAKEEYFWWIHRPFTAAIINPTYPELVAGVASSELESVCFGRLTDSMPVITESVAGPSMRDRFVFVYHADSIADVAASKASRISFTSDIIHGNWDRALFALSTLVTIYAFTVPAGKGQTRPVWTLQEPNQAAIEWALIYAHRLLKQTGNLPTSEL